MPIQTLRIETATPAEKRAAQSHRPNLTLSGAAAQAWVRRLGYRKRKLPFRFPDFLRPLGLE